MFRVVLIVVVWIFVWWSLVSYYTETFLFNDPTQLSGDKVEAAIHELNSAKQTEIRNRMVAFFDNKIGASGLRYVVTAYNDFQLAFEVDRPPSLTYASSTMVFYFSNGQKEVPYQTEKVIGVQLHKGEVYNITENIVFVPQELQSILVGPKGIVQVSTVGRGGIRQDLDGTSKLILVIVSIFFTVWLFGSFRVLIDFLQKGFGWKINWFKTPYCTERNINEETVAEPVKEYVRYIEKFLGRLAWTFAKTMPDTPHDYVVRDALSDADKKTFDAFSGYIKRNGYSAAFASKRYNYLHICGFKYWVIGNILNRAKDSQETSVGK